MRSPLPLDDDSQQLASATHLVVFQHGLLGSKHDFGRFVEIFRSQFHVDGLYLHSGESNGNSFFQTYDGVDQGGERLADEIQRLAQKMPRLRKLSMIGHSLGGLYNRYCIGVLLSRGFFDKIEPVNFVTLATPHLGIRRSHRHATNVVFNAVMTKIFSSCMARGQFMQALQMFKVRTLYANMFFDMQVPYSCASIRAYNPYRQDMKENLMSPIYTHIVLDSLKNARKLRDTLPLRIKRLALRYIKPNHLALLNVEDALHRASEDESIEANSVTTSNSINGRRHSSEPQEKKSASRGRSEHSGLFHSRRRGKSVSNAPSASHRRGDKPRPVPFVDGDVVLDQLPYAFTSDAQQDELRGMLLSVQSVGWRRIDVLFGSVMAHEHIIAKRAKVEKPLDSGIDIVHHVMDTFVL
ncbi:hypothetical protein PHYBOEH_001249 [Phytophthora boehmeriae]|uniref:DUF676 domain-containing protein n=1 Tax=Phytophthora boehmeriae TaxID=109152 RepID=A0A8T1WY02_9STRA|nr:hypothetical protein PHYBOEH_001249 [Phytophthora boehmeriae]